MVGGRSVHPSLRARGDVVSADAAVPVDQRHVVALSGGDDRGVHLIGIGLGRGRDLGRKRLDQDHVTRLLAVCDDGLKVGDKLRQCLPAGGDYICVIDTDLYHAERRRVGCGPEG